MGGEGSLVLHTVSLGLVLYGTWLLFSGIYTPLLMGLGAISCLAVVGIAHRMDVVDHEGLPIHLGWRAVWYWMWLAGEIVQANIDVARRILDPKMPIDPVLVTVKASQSSELGLVIHANSITLTPGTVSIRVTGDSILVHAVATELAEDVQSGAMDRRVTAMEGARRPQLKDAS